MFFSLIGGQINFLFLHSTRLNLNSIDRPVQVGWVGGWVGGGGGLPRLMVYTCSKTFVEAVKNNKFICSDSAAWLRCYKKNNNCDEKSLVYRYTQYVSKVAPHLEQECSQAVH